MTAQVLTFIFIARTGGTTNFNSIIIAVACKFATWTPSFIR